MNKSLVAFLVASTVALLTVIALRYPKIKQNSKIVGVTQPRGGTILEKYNNFVTDSNKRWGRDVVSLEGEGWVTSILHSVQFVYKHGDGKFRAHQLDLITEGMLNSLTNNVVSFFTAYADGSFDAFLQFHDRSSYSLNFQNFIDDKEVLAWVKQHNRDFQTDEQKLSAIWDFNTYDNARGMWVKDQIIKQKNDNKNPINLQAITQSLHDEFEKNVAFGKLKGFENYQISAVSKDDFYVYVFNATNAELSFETLAAFQNGLLPGTQTEGNRIFKYKNSPGEVVKSQGSCYYAIMTAAVRVNSCECHVPIAVAYYWSPQDDDWLPITMGRYSFGNYYALF